MGQDLDAVVPRVDRLGVRSSARAAGVLCDVHGSALFSLAWIILADRDDAEFVAAQAMLDACSGPVHAAHGSERWEMARYVYIRCVRHQQAARPGHDGSPDQRGTEKESTTLGLLSAHERAAIALALLGEHTYQEIADLVHLPRPEVAVLLRSGLHALRQAEN